jgi:hypothetical protein
MTKKTALPTFDSAVKGGDIGIGPVSKMILKYEKIAKNTQK